MCYLSGWRIKKNLQWLQKIYAQPIKRKFKQDQKKIRVGGLLQTIARLLGIADQKNIRNRIKNKLKHFCKCDFNSPWSELLNPGRGVSDLRVKVGRASAAESRRSGLPKYYYYYSHHYDSRRGRERLSLRNCTLVRSWLDFPYLLSCIELPLKPLNIRWTSSTSDLTRCGNAPRFWLQGIRCGSDLRSRFRVSGLCRVKGRLLLGWFKVHLAERIHMYMYICI